MVNDEIYTKEDYITSWQKDPIMLKTVKMIAEYDKRKIKEEEIHVYTKEDYTSGWQKDPVVLKKAKLIAEYNRQKLREEHESVTRTLKNKIYSYYSAPTGPSVVNLKITN